MKFHARQRLYCSLDLHAAPPNFHLLLSKVIPQKSFSRWKTTWSGRTIQMCNVKGAQSYCSNKPADNHPITPGCCSLSPFENDSNLPAVEHIICHFQEKKLINSIIWNVCFLFRSYSHRQCSAYPFPWVVTYPVWSRVHGWLVVCLHFITEVHISHIRSGQRVLMEYTVMIHWFFIYNTTL